MAYLDDSDVSRGTRVGVTGIEPAKSAPQTRPSTLEDHPDAIDCGAQPRYRPEPSCASNRRFHLVSLLGVHATPALHHHRFHPATDDHSVPPSCEDGMRFVLAGTGLAHSTAIERGRVAPRRGIEPLCIRETTGPPTQQRHEASWQAGSESNALLRIWSPTGHHDLRPVSLRTSSCVDLLCVPSPVVTAPFHTRTAPAPFCVLGFGAVFTSNPSLHHRLLCVARVTKHLALRQLRFHAPLRPTPDPVVDLLARVLVIHLETILAAALGARTVLLQVPRSAPSNPFSLISTLCFFVRVGHRIMVAGPRLS